MFHQCWANVVDGGPTLVKHWVDVFCLLGRLALLMWLGWISFRPSKQKTLTQRRFTDASPLLKHH